MKKRIDSQNSTRQKAVLAAKEKATALAKTLGSRIREPLLVEEDRAPRADLSSNVVFNNISTVSDDGADASESLAPGKISIRVRVKISFRLITDEK